MVFQDHPAMGGVQGLRSRMIDIRRATGTLFLVLVLAGIHALVLVFGDPDRVFLRLGLSRGGLATGDYWQLLTYGLLHGNLIHLFVNLAGLLIIGSRVERICGAAALAKIFWVGIVFGGLAQCFLAPAAQRGAPLVGASGGLAALVLWLTAMAPDARVWPLKISGRNLGRGILLAEGGFLIGGWLFPDMAPVFVAHACHLGGGIAGWWMAHRLLGAPPSLADLKRTRARAESGYGNKH